MKQLFIILLFPTFAWSQQRPLSVGDTIPVSLVQYLATHTITSSRDGGIAPLSIYDGEGSGVRVLDFWATWCTSCLAHFPEMEKFQKQFNGKLQFILINASSTGDDEKKIAAFFQKHKNEQGKDFSLAAIANDTIASKYFPHTVLPHYVWINANNRVAAITGAEHLTASSVSAFLQNEKLNWPLKNDFRKFDYKQSLFSLNIYNIPEFNLPQNFSYSAFASFMPGLAHGCRTYIDSAAQTIRITMIDLSIPELYKAATGNTVRAKILLSTKDSSRFVYNDRKISSTEWKTQNSFCYEAIFPLSLSAPERKQKILTDLDLHFHLSSVEKMIDKNTIIIVTDKPQKNSSK